MTAQAQHELTEILAPMLGTVNQRQAFVVAAFGLTSPIIPRLNFDVSAHTFIFSLCQTIAPDTALLDALLDEVKRSHGVDVGTRIDVLRPALHLWLRGGAVDKDAPKTSVFISYARADDDPDYDDASKSFLRRLYNALTEAGFNVWWDREKLPSRGLHFTKEIEDAIRACERFVLVVGPGALLSDYVRAEWTFALSECKPITPILRVGEYKLIPPELSDINAIDFRPTRNEIAAIADLVARLREQAPLGALHRVKPVPKEHIKREEIYNQTSIALTADQIASEANNIVIIHGVGGVGKSSLAAALAHDCQVRRMFRDGIIWLDIGQNPNIQTRQSDLGVALGDKRENYAGDAESGATRLSGLFNKNKTAALIVLDDVWDHQVLEYFPVQDTACRLLVTTRSAALAEPVSGLAIRLNMLTPHEGAALIRGRAGAGDENLYRQISTALGGHTLAVTLAAMRLKKKGAAYAQTILLGLQDTHDPFANLNVDQNNKNFNLSKSLEQSLALLDDGMKRRFWALGILPADSTFDIALLAALWGDTGIAAADRPAEDLIDAGLLEGSENGRMSVHRVLRAYAAALAEKSDEETGKSCVDDARDLLLDHVLDRMQLFESTPPYEWEEKLGFGFEYIHWAGNLFYDEFLDLVEYSSIELDVSEMAAPDFYGSASGDQTEVSSSLELEDLLPFVNIWDRGFHNYIESFGGGHDGKNWLATGLVATRLMGETVPHRAFNRAYFLKMLGLWHYRYMYQTLSLQYLTTAAKEFAAIGERQEEAISLMVVAQIKHMIGQPDEAKNAFERAIELFGTAGDLANQTIATHFFGSMYNTITQRDKAKPYLEQALALARQVHDQESEARTLRELGGLDSGFGNLESALSHLQESLEIWTRLDKQEQIAGVLCDFGRLHLGNNQIDLATRNYDQALRIARQLGDNATLLSVLIAVSDYYLSRDQTAQAIKTLTEAVEVGNRDGLAFVMPQSILTVLIVYHSELGDKTTALAQFEAALDKAEAAGWQYIANQPIEQFRFLIPLWRSGSVASKEDVEALSNKFGFELGAGLTDFINSPTDEKVRDVLERHPVLGDSYAEQLLQIFTNSLRFMDMNHAADILVKYYALIINSREITIGEAFERAHISLVQRQKDHANLILANIRRQTEAKLKMDKRLLSQRSFANYRLGNASSALADVDQLLQYDPSNWEHHVQRALILMELKRFDEAIEETSLAVEIEPAAWGAYIQRANARSKALMQDDSGSTNLDLALSDIQTALDGGGDHPLAYLVRTMIHWQMDDTTAALYDIDRVIALSRDNEDFAEAQCMKAAILCENKDYPTALSAVNMALEKTTTYQAAYSLRGEINRHLENYFESLADLHVALELDPADAEARFNRAMVYLQSKQTAYALAEFRECLALEPKEPRYYFWRGRANYQSEDYESALIDFSRSIELSPIESDYYAWRIATLSKIGKFRDAIADCTRAIEIEPISAELYRTRAAFYQALSEHFNAVQDFEKAIDISTGSDLESLMGLAASLLELGRYSETIKVYERVLERKDIAKTELRRKAQVYLPLAHILIGNYQTAIKMYNRIGAESQDAMYFANRGAAYREAPNTRQALRDFNHAIQLDPTDINFNYWRALLHIELKDYRKATLDFSRSLTLDVSTTNANSVKLWEGVLDYLNQKYELASVKWKQLLLLLEEEEPKRPGTIALALLLLERTKESREHYIQLLDSFLPSQYINAQRCYLRMLQTLLPKRKDIAEVRQWFLETSATKLK